MMSCKMLHQLTKPRDRRRPAGPTPLDDGRALTIRFAYPDDESALHDLAALDSQPLPRGPLLVAEVEGELWAAVSTVGPRRAIANPFRHTAALVALLGERADSLALSAPPRLDPQRSLGFAYR